jgi:hypothetical protein
LFFCGKQLKRQIRNSEEKKIEMKNLVFFHLLTILLTDLVGFPLSHGGGSDALSFESPFKD